LFGLTIIRVNNYLDWWLFGATIIRVGVTIIKVWQSFVDYFLPYLKGQWLFDSMKIRSSKIRVDEITWHQQKIFSYSLTLPFCRQFHLYWQKAKIDFRERVFLLTSFFLFFRLKPKVASFYIYCTERKTFSFSSYVYVSGRKFTKESKIFFSHFNSGLPDFSWSKHTKTGKNFQMTTNYTKLL
jgi:hypothetical protein